MMNPRFLLFTVLVLKFSLEASAMDCKIIGITMSCPIGGEGDKAFCCKSSVIPSTGICCDASDYLKENPGILAGIIVGVLVILIIITLCCCCFCSCCCLAQRRINRGAVLYGPTTQTVLSAPSASFQVVHQPPSQISNPPPYTEFANPKYTYQDQANPGYKY